MKKLTSLAIATGLMVTSLFSTVNAQDTKNYVLVVDKNQNAYYLTSDQQSMVYLSDNVTSVEGAVSVNGVITNTAFGTRLQETETGIEGRIWRYDDGVWAPMNSYANAVDVGANNGEAFAVTAIGQVAKYHVELDNFDIDFHQLPEQTPGVPERAVRVDVDEAGKPWVVSEKGDLYQLVSDGNGGERFEKLTLQFNPSNPASTLTVTDVGCGDGKIYVVGSAPLPFHEGSNLYVLDTATGKVETANLGYSAKRVDVDETGAVYLTVYSGYDYQLWKATTTVPDSSFLDFKVILPGFEAIEVGAQ